MRHRVYCRKAVDQEPGSGKRSKQQQDSTDNQADFQFGKVEVGQGGALGARQQQKGKRKKPTKEQLLQEAVQKQKQQQDPQAGAEVQVAFISVLILNWHAECVHMCTLILKRLLKCVQTDVLVQISSAHCK